MARPALAPVAAKAVVGRRFLTFQVDERRYALPSDAVSEVIRLPMMVRVPQAPKGLLGIGNLRGTVLPVASLRGLLGQSERPERLSRAIVLAGAAPVALAVDAVEALVRVEDARVETRQAQLAAEPGEILKGTFPAGDSGSVVKVLDIASLIAAAFVAAPRARRAAGLVADIHHEAIPSDARRMLVTFEVAGQEYALALESVQEILPAPQSLAAMPRSEETVLGVTPFRDSVLPLLSLRALLGFTVAGPDDGREKIVVARVGGALVGLLADRMKSILPAEESLMEPVPAVLAARAGGEARIKSLYRGDAGRRLISVLAPEQLFREDVMARLGENTASAPAGGVARSAGRQRQFVVFRLGDDEFGLPIEVVEEVARVPGQITRLPKTPKFLEGVVNLRGEVLPVVDQRRRFDMPAHAAREECRLLVVRTELHRAGLIVDSVTEVLRCLADDIEPAPSLTNEALRLVMGVVNLEQAGRIVLLLDPGELLSRAERSLLDAFAARTRE